MIKPRSVSMKSRRGRAWDSVAASTGLGLRSVMCRDSKGNEQTNQAPTEQIKSNPFPGLGVVGQTFLSAGSSDFLVASPRRNRALFVGPGGPSNRQAGKPGLRWKISTPLSGGANQSELNPPILRP